jgi:hypothetical protein
MPILAILYMRGGGGDGSSQYVHKAKELGSQSTNKVGSHAARGSVPRMQGDDFTSEPGGILEVTMWLCTLFGFDLGWVWYPTMSCWF